MRTPKSYQDEDPSAHSAGWSREVEGVGLRTEEIGLRSVVGWTGSGAKQRLWGSTGVLV